LPHHVVPFLPKGLLELLPMAEEGGDEEQTFALCFSLGGKPVIYKYL
jgi:hypothetical protein